MIPILAITWKNVYTTFRDRNLLLIMLATPLALATIIGLAFGGGGVGGGSLAGFSDIPVALVNLDEGVEQNGQHFVYGSTFNQLFSPTDDEPTAAASTACPTDERDTSADVSLDQVLRVSILDDPAAARAAVVNGTYTAAIIIPPDYSQRLISTTPNAQPLVEVYGNAGRPITASIVSSIASAITNQTIKGVAAIQATIGQLTAEAQANPAFGLYFATVAALGGWEPDFACAFGGTLDPLTVEREALTLTQTRSTFIQILVSIGAGQAVFFALFTAQGMFGNIFEEKKLGTLMRLFVAPVPRRTIITGYLFSTFMVTILQLVLLVIALTVIGSVIEGRPQFIWGTSPLILVMLGAITLSVCGISVLVISIVNNPQQSGVVSSLLNTFFAVLGGTFGMQFPREVAGFSPIYWASDGLTKLSNGSSDIGLNLLVLLVQGSVMFAIGLFFFNRRKLV